MSIQVDYQLEKNILFLNIQIFANPCVRILNIRLHGIIGKTHITSIYIFKLNTQHFFFFMRHDPISQTSKITGLTWMDL